MADDNDFIDKIIQQRPHLGQNAGRSDAVDPGRAARYGDRMPDLLGRKQGRCGFNLGPDDPHFFAQRPHRQCNARYHPAAADGNDHRIHIRNLLRDFHTNRAIADHNRQFCHRMHEKAVGPGLTGHDNLPPIGKRDHVNGRPHFTQRLYLNLGGAFGYENINA